MRLLSLLVLGLALVAAAAGPASARLGESEAEARARDYGKFGAVLPSFESDGGKVVLECWSSPPSGWTEDEAMAFAKLLLPDELRAETPRALPGEASDRVFVFGDGTRLEISEVDGVVYGVEVAAPGYPEGAC